jgi:hypothetical protein
MGGEVARAASGHQHARKIIDRGLGWIDRLEKALNKGSPLLPAASGTAALKGRRDDDRE